jgi:DNA-binding MarR family transcriptional regulator
MTKRGAELESKQSSLQTGYMQVLRYLQDALLNDKRLILELEQLKSKLTSIEQRPVGPHLAPSPALADASLSSGDLLSSLTPTERQTVEILIHEGAKGAPELGRRMRKSREHMARLMKKLYMEGYVDRESNYAPFRYKLSEKVRQILESQNKTLTAAPSEKA